MNAPVAPDRWQDALGTDVLSRTQIMAHDEWLTLHKDPMLITASVVPRIMNEDRYESAFTEYHRRRAWIEGSDEFDKPETYAMRRGHALEPEMHWYLETKKGYKVLDPGEYTMIAHKDYPWLQCTLDRIVYENEVIINPGIAEMKSHGAWTPAATEFRDGEPPDSVQIQAQTQMMCTGLTWGLVVADLGSGDPVVHEVTANPALQEIILQECIEFRECVETGSAPNVEGHASDFETLKKLHPDDNGETVEVPEDVAAHMAAFLDYREEIKELEAERDYAKSRIIQAIGDNTFAKAIGDGQSFLFSYKTQGRKGEIRVKLDEEIEERLKEAAIPFKVTPPSTHRVLRPHKAKGF